MAAEAVMGKQKCFHYSIAHYNSPQASIDIVVNLGIIKKSHHHLRTLVYHGVHTIVTYNLRVRVTTITLKIGNYKRKINANNKFY
jgi:hypothetical protein